MSLTVEKIKEKIKKRIEFFSIEPSQDKMTIGEEFEFYKRAKISRDVLASLLKWIKENEK